MAGQPPALESLELDAPRADEVLVRIEACGVCHTDLIAPAVFGTPTVLGHEGAGVVLATGAQVASVRAGDRVALTFGSCGTCGSCVDGAPAYCAHAHELQFGGHRLDGSGTLMSAAGPVRGAFFQQSSFATHAIATARNVVRIPDALPFELAAPLGCGIITGAGTVLNALRCEPGSALAVFGSGSVGLSAVMAARLAGCGTIIAVDVNPQRLALARELGATHTLDAREGDVVARIHALTRGGARYSIESAGADQTFRDAIDCLAKRGICALLTVPNLGQPIEYAPLPILLGRTVTGVLEGASVPQEFIPRLAQLYLEGLLPYDRLVSRYSFGDLPRALADASAGRVIKAVITMS